MSEQYRQYSEDLEEPLLPDVFTAPEATIQAAHDKLIALESQQEAIVSRRMRRPIGPRNGEVQTTMPDPELVKYAAQMAGGDRRRLIFNRDGTIVIAKHPVRNK